MEIRLAEAGFFYGKNKVNELIYSIEKKINIPFYSAGVAKGSSGNNYVVWQIVSDVPDITIDYKSDFSKIRVQFDIYSKSERAVFEICEKLESEALGRGLVLLRNGPFLNPDTKMYRRTVDISFFKKGK